MKTIKKINNSDFNINRFSFVHLVIGDLIDVHIKQEDGWWVGALKNHVGIFPATYVEEIL